MKKFAILLIVIMVVACVLVACNDTGTTDGNKTPAADIVVNNIKTLNAGITAVYQNEDGEFIATHRSKFKVVDDDFTVNELAQLFFDKSYGVTALDVDGNGSIDQLTLSYGNWPDITDITLPNTEEMQWVIRDSSYQIVADTTASVVDNAEYYYSYEKIDNPEPFTADDLSQIADADNKPNFYINNVSTKTVKLVLTAQKADKSVETLFNGTVQITDDDLTFEEVVKAACDARGILYSISAGFVNSIGVYANDMAVSAWWTGGFTVDGVEYGNYSGIHVIPVGDGAELYMSYKYNA